MRIASNVRLISFGDQRAQSIPHLEEAPMLRACHFIAILATAVAVPASALLAGPNEKQRPSVHGVVIEVRKDADKDNGSLTVRIHHGKREARGKAEVRTFQVLPTTKFVKVHHGSKDRDPATFREVHEGEHVHIRPMDDRPNFAQAVAIVVK
jgi:hypothetical protein